VETANRFARDLMVQEVGYAKLRERGIELIAADSPTSFLDGSSTGNARSGVVPISATVASRPLDFGVCGAGHRAIYA
jgi:hypothetical protein